ncbi:chemotaxis protein CheA [Clostridium kluyveri]|uniref:chemotaxis protein CheA n=1 Tax=Clostridium kluyveri TaxID=1534 RepID=UPI002247B77F|nr:chemotaxis protein CheA [Clostridium kluyveri]UZQ50796.1 chemotaxis protein CheA [Clostridium kluyveri]
MTNKYSNDPILESYIFETSDLINKLETLVLDNENSSCYCQECIDEIFRIVHTIKGSSAMMSYDYISMLAHSIEDLLYFIRENNSEYLDYKELSDLILKSVDFIKGEIDKIKAGNGVQGICDDMINENIKFLEKLSKCDLPEENKIVDSQEVDKSDIDKKDTLYKAVIFFEDSCQMENLRAYTVVETFKKFCHELYYVPEDIIDNDNTCSLIREEGFKLFIKCDKSYDEVEEILKHTVFLKSVKLMRMEEHEEVYPVSRPKENVDLNGHVPYQPLLGKREKVQDKSNVQNFINVKVEKLDKLMDLVEEMVIAESMVTENPDLKGLKLDNFRKSARQLRKITKEIQDTVMSVRMVPVYGIFHKMNRIVHDMNKKLNKKVKLKFIGEDTEVDKNIIEHISDPIMHLVRNSIDHGIESAEYRRSLGKSEIGTIILEAKNQDNYVVVMIKDDGAGFNKERILKKAHEKGLLKKPADEMSDKEIYDLIFIPGFSIKENITEFSGRGVGMDVVIKNIKEIGGIVTVQSKDNEGTLITIKIPSTLAIIDGINVRVGDYYYTIPVTIITKFFRPKADDIFHIEKDEMIMVREKCYPVIRIHKLYGIETSVKELADGIIVMAENEDKFVCIFADELLGQQQVVVKPLPDYVKRIKSIKGISGCTVLGDGSMSLILNIGELNGSIS